MQTSPPPDLGDGTLFGRVGLALLALLAAIVWRVYDAFTKRFDGVDDCIEEAKREADERSEQLERDMKAELALKASAQELDRQRDHIGELFGELKEIRKEMNLQYISLSDKMTAQNSLVIRAVQNAQPPKDAP